MSGREIVRVFDGRDCVHVGVFTDHDRAVAKATAIAKKARRRGQNVNVTVRPLLEGGTRLDEILDQLEERGTFNIGSYAGVPERQP